jgi:hypothetical protein
MGVGSPDRVAVHSGPVIELEVVCASVVGLNMDGLGALDARGPVLLGLDDGPVTTERVVGVTEGTSGRPSSSA